MIPAGATKHSPRGCTICRDYIRHERRARPIGDWTKRLAGGRRGLLWTLDPRCATCKRCKKVRR